MPELKTLFIKGKMNKDLDERLVPQGEYRDALNVSVSYSEESDVGALQNILGNTEIAGGLTFPSSAKTIGVVKDTENDKIYWIATTNLQPNAGTGVSYICELDYSTGEGPHSIDIILVNHNNAILNLDKRNLITGISILDKVIYFTDNLNEPRQVDIEYWRTKSPNNFSSTTTGLTADRISLYKKGPLNAPTFQTLSSSIRTGAGTEGGAAVTATKDIFDITIGATSQNITFSTAPNYQTNDIIRLKHEYIDSNDLTQKSEARILLTSGSGTNYVFTLLSKTENIKDGSFAYTALLEEEEPLFELKFAKFSFRYKYTNGQFSTISPFSLPAFIPGDFSYLSKDAFNTGMTNTVRQIILQGWGALPNNQNVYTDDIDEIEVLYKDTTSAIIYIVEAIKRSSGTGNPFPTTFEIKDEQIFKAIQSNQLLRSFDSIPKKAKALEITGNRLILANYTQNFNITTEPAFNVNLVSRSSNTQKLSIKSNRTYQLGIVLQDSFGRQTPVFTHKSGVLKTKISSSDLTSAIKVSTTFASLDSALTHYKYYIKETSKEYYNLAASNFYEDEEGYIYISFPSAEVNKISTDDYIILKKINGSSNALKAANNKYKVLSIDSSPPPFLANKEEVVYDATFVEFGQDFSGGTKQITRLAGKTPVAGSNKILLFKGRKSDETDDEVSETFDAALTIGAKIRFVKNNTKLKSEIYTISAKAGDDDLGDTMDLSISFDRPFGDDVEIIYDTSASNSTYTGVGIQVVQEVSDVGNQKYQNQFFVKVNKTSTLLSGLKDDVSVDDLGVIGQAFIQTGTPSPSVRRYQLTANGNQNDNTFTIETYSNYTEAEDQFENEIFGNNIKVDNFIRVADSSGNNTNNYAEVYKITAVTRSITTSGKLRIAVTLEKNLLVDASTATDTRFDVLTFDTNKISDFSNPPVFEVEPEEGVLDIYYETEKTYPISDLDGNTSQTLDYANCFSFGNGVESDRIRDDFNTPTLGKGVRVSTVFEDNYKEEVIKSGLIFSGIYNGKNGINRLNQFIIAENITKEANPIYGSIQKLNTRDTDITILCDDKILKVPANKDILFQADGNPQLTSTNAFLGTIIPYTGNYGCQNPESFADHIYRAYFVDRARGKVLRLSNDGITEISNYGMKNFFKDKLVVETGVKNVHDRVRIIGAYDTNKDQYDIALDVEDTVVAFSESINGFPTRKSYHEMEAGISLNNEYFTFKDGKIFSHTNTTRNTFYGTKTDSQVTILLNGNPSNIKNFRTLNYQGNTGWTATLSATHALDLNPQTGVISAFEEKEGIYYNYIKGSSQIANFDSGAISSAVFKTSILNHVKALNVQGLGTPASISSNTATFVDMNTSLQVNDKVFNDTNTNVRTVSAINGNVVTFSGGNAENVFYFFSKDERYNTSGILGYFMSVTMTNTSTSKKEIYSIGSEISLSS